MTVDHSAGDIDELLAIATRVVPQHGERLPLVHLVALHEDALRAFGLRATSEGALEIVELGESPEGDVERTLQLLGRAVHDVREHPALGGLLEEFCIVTVEYRYHGALGLPDNALDQLQRMCAAAAEAHERDVGAFARGESADVDHLGRARDDSVAERGNELRDQGNAVFALVRDQDAQAVTVGRYESLLSIQAWRGLRASTW